MSIRFNYGDRAFDKAIGVGQIKVTSSEGSNGL